MLRVIAYGRLPPKTWRSTSVILSSETAVTARAPVPARDGDRLATSPPSSAPESAAPTCKPAGTENEPLRALLPLLSSPRLPDPFASDFDPVSSGVPEAPGFPCGFAEKVPRRLPAGIATGPEGATG